MDHKAALPYPLEQVFGHLADPASLSDWLPQVTGILAGEGAPGQVDAPFPVRIGYDGPGGGLSGTGELIAYEPPWSVAYRLMTGTHTHVLRLTCTASGAGTHVHIHQSGSVTLLAVDLARLRRALACPAGETNHS